MDRCKKTNLFYMQTMSDRVILADENDQAIGDMDKLEVHQKGLPETIPSLVPLP